ncbi:MAG: succinate--CoA ligase subunit beta [bacterium]
MRLFEYEAKEIFSRNGIPVPRSGYAETKEEVVEAAKRMNGPVVLKPQTITKARGKAGLVLFANNPLEAAECFARLQGRTHNGEKVRGVLVEEKISVLAEFFLAVTVDYTNAVPVLLSSPWGGVEVEVSASKRPETIKQISLSSLQSHLERHASELGSFLSKYISEVEPDVLKEQLQFLLGKMFHVFKSYDCELVEINPLGLRHDGTLVALDGLMVIDDEARFRHPELVKPRAQSEEEFSREEEFRKRGWTYIPMEGEIGILSSGAGITMAILDLIHFGGGRPANFLDTAQMDRKGIYDAFKIFHNNPNTKVLLVNIFAGLNRCDELSLGITDYLRDFNPPFPIVVRMIGNRDNEGRTILQQAGIKPLESLEEAVTRAIEEARCVS